MSLTNHPNCLGRGAVAPAGAGGIVGGPTSSTDKALVRWNGTTGTLVQNGVVIEADNTGNLTGATDQITTTAVGIGYTNQPSNDSVTVASSNAGDTTQVVTLIGTTTATNTVVVQTVALNGTTGVVSAKVDWGQILAVKLSASCAGTVTISKTTGLLAITTILTTVLSSGVTTVVNTAAFNQLLSAVASGASTKQIGFGGTNTSGTQIYDSKALNGTTAVASNVAFYTLTEIYRGDVGGATTVTVTTNGSWSLTGGAGGTLAFNTLTGSITLTPSGTGAVVIPNGLYIWSSSHGDNTQSLQLDDSGGNMILRSANGIIGFRTASAGADSMRLAHSGNLLIGGLTTDGTGVLQFPAATTSAGGTTFGTDIFLYRNSAGVISLDGTSAASGLIFKFSGTGFGSLLRDGSTGDLVINSNATNVLRLQTGGSNVLTLDASQNATFFGTYSNYGGAAGAANTETYFQKSVTAIANASATTVLTVTIPNAAHSARVRVTLVGSLGAGGTIGANEATGTIAYDISITRTTGVNAVASISTAYGSASSNVAGGTTITVAGTLAAVSGAVGATNTLPIQVTITRGAGTSTNHTCIACAEVINANTSGVTIA